MDKEKIIKDLEECLSASCRGFRTCPYNDEEWDIMREALSLLKEQEAKTPVECVDEGYRYYRCSVCGYPDDLLREWNYCPFCGQKVKWE